MSRYPDEFSTPSIFHLFLKNLTYNFDYMTDFYGLQIRHFWNNTLYICVKVTFPLQMIL